MPVSTRNPPCPRGQHPLLTGVPASLPSRASPASAPGTAPFGGTPPSPPPSPSTWSSPCPTSPNATGCGRASNKEQAVSLRCHPRVSLPRLSSGQAVGQGTPIAYPCWEPPPPPNAPRPQGCVLSPCPRWVMRVPVPVPGWDLGTTSTKLGAPQSRQRRWGQFVFQQNSLRGRLYLHLGRGYLQDPGGGEGYVQGERGRHGWEQQDLSLPCSLCPPPPGKGVTRAQRGAEY